jgi:hypothetical protein
LIPRNVQELENRPRRSIEVSPSKKSTKVVQGNKENDNLEDSPEKFERSYISETVKQVPRKIMA